MQFIRFSGNSPNPFYDPNHKDFVELAKSYFIPRISDNGKTSFYKSKESKNKYIAAGFISIKSSKPDKQILLFIDNSVFIESKIRITFERSSKLYSCIANYHFCADYSDNDKLTSFLINLKMNLGRKNNKDYLQLYKKNEIIELLKTANISCGNYEKNLLSKWVSDILIS